MKSADRFKRTKHRLSLRGYANILRYLAMGPSTVPDVARVTDTSETSIREVLRRMEDLGLIHAVEWAPSKKGPWRAMYAFNRGTPKPYPGKRRGGQSGPWNFRPELLAFSHTIKALIEGPTSEQDLHELSGQSRTTLRYLMRHCKAIGLIHIGEWNKEPGCVPQPMWAIGNKTDAPRPKPVPLADCWRRANVARVSRHAIVRVIPALAAAPRLRQQEQRATAEA